jgi:hypothetical protein
VVSKYTPIRTDLVFDKKSGILDFFGMTKNKKK